MEDNNDSNSPSKLYLSMDHKTKWYKNGFPIIPNTNLQYIINQRSVLK